MTTKLDPISLLRSLERAHLQQAAKLRSAASAQEPSEFLRRLADVRAAQKRTRTLRERLTRVAPALGGAKRS